MDAVSAVPGKPALDVLIVAPANRDFASPSH